MKIQSFVITGALGLGLVNLASAVDYVYITGSTAMRGIVYHAFFDGNNVFDAAPSFVGYNGSSASGCNFMVFSNTIASTPTIVKCHWSGSEAGIADVSNANQQSFLSDSVALNGTFATGVPSGSQLTTNGVDLALADNTAQYSSTPGSTATAAFVGVIPFTFVRGTNSLAAAAAVNNITDAQFRAVIKGGQKLALFTGNVNDTTNYVYISGRDSSSGTRVNTFGQTGFGIRATPQQIELDGTGNMIDLSGAGDYSGDYGFSSGGTLAGTLGKDTATSADQVHIGRTGFVTIAYLGRSDANTAIAVGGVELSYNGVSYSSNNIVEGKYAFWGNEQVLKRAGVSAPGATVYSKLTTAIPAKCDGVTAFSSTMMHAQRSGPTLDPSHK
ncbi:MAG: hypothetical protein JWR69_1991 [Pedosphaera sp.]|nr:hypothetical protein [Pedosphaera sp.]